MLAFALSLLGDWLGCYALLRLTRRWWLLLPGALFTGAVSGLVATFALGWLAEVRPGRLLGGMIGAASLHALIAAVGVFWLRWWLSPRR